MTTPMMVTTTPIDGRLLVASDNSGMSAAATSWNFAEEDEIAPGLTALSHLGGGKRYEAYLA